MLWFWTALRILPDLLLQQEVNAEMILCCSRKNDADADDAGDARDAGDSSGACFPWQPIAAPAWSWQCRIWDMPRHKEGTSTEAQDVVNVFFLFHAAQLILLTQVIIIGISAQPRLSAKSLVSPYLP